MPAPWGKDQLLLVERQRLHSPRRSLSRLGKRNPVAVYWDHAVVSFKSRNKVERLTPRRFATSVGPTSLASGGTARFLKS